MALVYKGPISGSLDSAKQDYSLFELLTSEGEFFVSGIRIMRKGSPEYDEDLTKFRKRLEKKTPPAELEEIMKRASTDDVRVTSDVPFNAMHYRGMRLLYDAGIRVIGDIAIARKQIDIFYLAFPFTDTARKAAMNGHYMYDGTLKDALEEFRGQDFTFALWNAAWGRDTSKLTPIEKASIDDVIRFASQR